MKQTTIRVDEIRPVNDGSAGLVRAFATVSVGTTKIFGVKLVINGRNQTSVHLPQHRRVTDAGILYRPLVQLPKAVHRALTKAVADAYTAQGRSI